MASKIFRKEVEQELKNLNKEQLVQFAWRCAVRVLPLLGSKGNFNYWNIKDKQKHIYAILNAIDFAAAAIKATNRDVVVFAADAALNASNAVIVVDTDRTAFYTARAAMYTARAVVMAYYASKAAAIATKAAEIGQVYLESVILQDIKS
ncbi:hypothetical protein KAH94_05470, partial [bacterium]|nr:hypothetical protein [bacterium]